MRIRNDTPLRTAHIRVTAVLSENTTVIFRMREGGPEARFRNDLPRRFIQRPEPAKQRHWVHSRWTVRSTWSLEPFRQEELCAPLPIDHTPPGVK